MSAHVVKAHGVTGDGRVGVRGFRVHCPDYGYLTRVHEGWHKADHERRHHDRHCYKQAPRSAA